MAPVRFLVPSSWAGALPPEVLLVSLREQPQLRGRMHPTPQPSTPSVALPSGSKLWTINSVGMTPALRSRQRHCPTQPSHRTVGHLSPTGQPPRSIMTSIPGLMSPSNITLPGLPHPPSPAPRSDQHSLLQLGGRPHLHVFLAARCPETSQRSSQTLGQAVSCRDPL